MKNAHPILRINPRKVNYGRSGADFGKRHYEVGDFENTQANLSGFLDDLKSTVEAKWEETKSTYIDPYVDAALNTVGLTDAQAEQIKKDASDAFREELDEKKSSLLQDLLNLDDPRSTASTVKSTVASIQAHPAVQAIPGGIYTIVGGVGLIAAYYMLRGRGAA